jgi:hypothetical protein
MSVMETGASVAPAPRQVRMKKSSAREVLRQEIEDLQREMDAKLKALEALEKAESTTIGQSVKTYRYANMRTHKAIRIYLESVGVMKTIADIAHELIEGGGMYGKRKWRAEQNVEVSVTMHDGLETCGGKVGLSEWFAKGGKYSHLKSDPKTPARKRS